MFKKDQCLSGWWCLRRCIGSNGVNGMVVPVNPLSGITFIVGRVKSDFFLLE